jgi:hypothetical protein
MCGNMAQSICQTTLPAMANVIFAVRRPYPDFSPITGPVGLTRLTVLPSDLLCRRVLPALSGKFGAAPMNIIEIASCLIMPIGSLLVGLWALYFARTITKQGRNR